MQKSLTHPPPRAKSEAELDFAHEYYEKMLPYGHGMLQNVAAEA